MTNSSSARLAFLMAVATASIIQIRPLFLTHLQSSVHLVMPEELDAPTLGTISASIPTMSKGLDQESDRNTSAIAAANENTDRANIAQSSPRIRPVDMPSSNTTTLGPIFYNAFVPKERQNATLEIIREQIEQRNKSDPNAPILYTLIGSESVNESIQHVCQPNCTKRDYLEQGNEIDTLQALWKHCQDHPHEIVTYIHDKGSFHPSSANRGARRVGTTAALECRRLMLDNEKIDNIPENKTTNTTKIKKKAQCSLCSYRFYAIPVFHARANMWSAKCSYIRNLISPRDYEERALNMHMETFNHSILGPTKYACIKPYQHSDRFLGLGRYAMERWVVNNPNVEPCDALSKFEVRNQKKSKKANTAFTPQLTPSPQKRALNSGMAAYKTSWERLAGRLFEWKYLYGTKPPKSSWVWKYYKRFKEGNQEFLASCKAQQKSAIQNMTKLNITLDGKPMADLDLRLP